MRAQTFIWAVVVAAAVACDDSPPSPSSQCIAARRPRSGAAVALKQPPATAAVDYAVPTCAGPAQTLPACPSASVTEARDSAAPALHIDLPEAITYASWPPAAGPHRGQWAPWGEFTYLPPQRWLHNLEHGGVAFLYHPCADPKLVDALRGFARCRSAGAGSGPFRWVLTPIAALDAPFSVVAWGWRLKGGCFDAAAISAFLDAHYNKAPENVPDHGSWDYLYLGL